MQAITIAIGKTGVNFFAQHYLSVTLQNLLAQMTAPNKTVPVPKFTYSSGQDWWDYSKISIGLSNGVLKNFNAIFQNVIQGVSNDGKNTPVFTLNFYADKFSAHYNWLEKFHYEHHYVEMEGKIPVWKEKVGNSSNPYTFAPVINLNTAVTVQFLFDSSKTVWDISVYGTSATSKVIQDNIPSASILNGQDNSCAGTHIDDATAQAIDAIDFSTPINSLISGVIKTIPASGDLGNGIVYDFSLGDSNLLFPNNDGIQMGVKGGASYEGTAFSDVNPPNLPLPVPPTDSDPHDLNMYVSNYEIDALNWAYYKAGKLNLLIKPQDLSDPQLLEVSTYTSIAKQLDPYAAFVMFAQITQKSAPVTAFQIVYFYSREVMALLENQLPSNVYQLIQGMAGNAYLSQADVETFLKEATVPSQYYEAIEKAAKISAMVLTQSIDYTLLIQNEATPQPDIKFSVSRTDVLTNLMLGASTNNTQTMQFGFVNASNTATFESSSIAGLDGLIFESLWLIGLEPSYAQILTDLGKTGTPLPIMENFQFDFNNAELSIQEGYVSILANVNYKTN